MNNESFKTTRIDLQKFELMVDELGENDPTDATDISAIVEEPEPVTEGPSKKPSKKKSPLSIIAFVFFLLALLIAVYLLGLHYGLFPDFLAPAVDRVLPGADIIPKRHQVCTYEISYAPEVPDEYTELMLSRGTDEGYQNYLVYAFTDTEGNVQYRAYVRKTVNEYSLVTDELAEDVQTHNNREITRVSDSDGKTQLTVYKDDITQTVDYGFVKVNISAQPSDKGELLYDYEIADGDAFCDPSKEPLGKCTVEEIADGYGPEGAEGIEAVPEYTSLFKIPVSIYTDTDGSFRTYNVYYIYGSFGGEKTGFYPADKDGAVIPGGLMNSSIALKPVEVEEERTY